jgi:hypothetical protein
MASMQCLSLSVWLWFDWAMLPRRPRGRWSYCIFGCAVLLGVLPARAGAQRTIIPLPEVIEDPNEGTTVGFLPVVLIASEAKSVRSIFAPDIRYNDITGVTPTLRFFDYPNPQQKYFLIAGKGTQRGEYAEGDYTQRGLLDGWLDVWGNARHEQDPFERFFGFGNRSPSSNEANFTSNTDAATFWAGLHLPASLQVSLLSRIRHVRIARGGVTNLPQVRDPASGFSNINGTQGATIVGERFGLAYDTRDATDIPTEGIYANTGVEIVDKAIGSSSSFMKYGIEGKAFVPLRDDKKYVVALHSALDYIQNGDNAPFYELSSVGGIHSLRAYGFQRFTDNNRFMMQAELRTNVYEREIFGVRGHLEIAPFIDAAKVFADSHEFPIENLHLVGGLGFRAVIVPQVVAYVDFGSAGGGPAAYTGIDYPF